MTTGFPEDSAGSDTKRSGATVTTNTADTVTTIGTTADLVTMTVSIVIAKDMIVTAGVENKMLKPS